jgi:hypothetical protein
MVVRETKTKNVAWILSFKLSQVLCSDDNSSSGFEMPNPVLILIKKQNADCQEEPLIWLLVPCT